MADAKIVESTSSLVDTENQSEHPNGSEEKTETAPSNVTVSRTIQDGDNKRSSTSPHPSLQSDPIIPFGGSAPPQDHPDKAIVGGKGLGLQEMHRLGVLVPPGFTLTTPLCQMFQDNGDLPAHMWKAVEEAVARVEQDMGKKYGDKENPLLFSCRSGGAVSMPGMMDTVLNIGLNSETVEGLAKATGNPRFAYDAFRRLLDMYGDVVLGIDHEAFEERFQKIKDEEGVFDDVHLSAEALKRLTEEYKQVYVEHSVVFPEDPMDQLKSCVRAVFGSWMAARAIKYREINGIENLIGTACNIQTMVRIHRALLDFILCH
jgi:pyruvate,orthophosphate dikinase